MEPEDGERSKKQEQQLSLECVTRKRRLPPKMTHVNVSFKPSLIVQNKFTLTSDYFIQLAESHYSEPGQSDPNSRKTQVQWIKSVGFPRGGKPKEKSGKEPQGRFLKLCPRPPSCKG